MAVKRRLPQGTQSTTGSSGEANPVTAFEDNADLWNNENELKLLQTLITHKPTGISKHFQMALILNRLSQGKYRKLALSFC